LSLPRLDLSALTHNAAKWPLPGKALLGCALAGVVFVVGDFIYLSPSRQRLHGVEAQEVVLQLIGRMGETDGETVLRRDHGFASASASS